MNWIKNRSKNIPDITHATRFFLRPVTLSIGKSAFTSGLKSSSSYLSISPTKATERWDKWIITLNASLEPNLVLQIYSSVREQVNNDASYFQMAYVPGIYLVLKFLINFLFVMIFLEVNKCVKWKWKKGKMDWCRCCKTRNIKK